MHLNHQKERFSDAYIRAVTAAAGYDCYKPGADLDSVDWVVAAAGGRNTTRSPRVELQLKCSSRDLMDAEAVRLPIKLKNYDDLRATTYMVPRILVVVIVPDDVAAWISQSEQELILRHCAYWVSLRGWAETSNDFNVTVKVPREQQFSIAELQAMMTRIDQGGLP